MQISRTELSRILGMTPSAIDKWPIMPRRKGRLSYYNFSEVITYLYEKASESSADTAERKDLDAQRARLVAAQADKAELVAQQLAGQLVRLDIVESVVMDSLYNLAASIKMLPAAAPRLDGDAAINRQVLEQVQDEILKNIREWNPSDYQSQIIDDADDGEESSDGRATKADSKPARGPKKMAKRGRQQRGR